MSTAPTTQVEIRRGETEVTVLICDFGAIGDEELKSRAKSYQNRLTILNSVSPQVVSHSVLEEGAHPNRVRSYLEGRACLDALLSRSLIEENEKIHLSLTHSGGISASALTRSRNGAAPRIGIDLELTSRDFSQLKLAKELSPEAKSTGLLTADIWCMKEACFKAAHPELGVYRQIQVTSKDSAQSDQGHRFWLNAISHPGARIWVAGLL